jgi:hypothetical protein
MFTLDNRRLLAFRSAGLDIPYRIVNGSSKRIAKEIARKLSTINDGWNVIIKNFPF